MDPARFRRLEEEFEALSALDGAAREARIARLEKEDVALASEVRALLDADVPTRGSVRWESPVLPKPEEGGTLQPGDRVGGWEILRPLAEGGMGEVVLARRADRDWEQLAALKLLREGLQHGSFARRFQQERRTLAQLDHPHIAALLDGGETEGGLPWLAMQYVEGEHLTAYADESGLDMRGRVRLMLPVCAAVHYAHQRLIVHRDLKPANIKVTPDGEPVLLDFGIAKLLENESADSAEPLTRGVQVFTPEYASPEQVRGEPVSTASDVYSLGVVLYRLLSGVLPQDSATATAWQASRAVAEGELRPLRAREPGVPRDLDAIVMRCLRLEPERRYASVLGLAEDLEAWLRGMPVRARPDTAGYRLRRFLVRNRWPVGFAAAAVLVAVAGTAGVLHQQRVALREARTVERVSDFLVQLFDARDPWAEGLEGTSLRSIFDRGLQLAEEELGDEPEVRAELLAVLGRVLRNLGEEEDAAALLAEALELDPGLERRDPARQADRLFAVGVALHRAGHEAEAVAPLEQCLRLRSARFDAPDARIASALNTLGLVRWRLGEQDEGVALLEAALGQRETLLSRAAGGASAEGSPDLDTLRRDVATTRSNLAAIALQDGDATEAVRRFRGAVEAFAESSSGDHPDLATAHNNLGMALHAEALDEEAERQLRTALTMRERLFPDGHPHVAASHNNLGLLYYDLGRLEEARDAFRTALALVRAKASEDHVLVGAFRANLEAVEEELAAAAAG